MGNIVSDPVELTQQQKDIQRLSERFPFGDAEFRHLYTAYSNILKQEKRESFLGDWACACIPDSENILAEQEERRMLIQVVETKILANDFGNRLHQAAFMTVGDTNPYSESNIDSSSPQLVDDFTRTARIDKIFEGFTLSSRRGAAHTTKIMFDACIPSSSHPTRKRAMDFVSQGYRLALATAFLQAAANDEDMGDYVLADSELELDKKLEAFAKSIVERARVRRSQCGLPAENKELEDGLVELEDVQDWAESVAPLYASILPTFFHEILFPKKSYPPSRTAFDFPKVLSESEFFFNSHSPTLFKLACLSNALAGSYFRLYASSNDGLSFNRLQNALLGYSGPTLLIIRATNDAVFGAFTASAWKESKDFYGNTDCFLFSISPSVAVYRPSGSQRNFMYCNSYARSRGYDKQAHGIGFGGSVDEPRLFLSESFDHCRAGTRDLTFENGSLLPLTESGTPQTSFDIDSVEVWGVGGDDIVKAALDERQKARAIKEEGIRRARKVDKAQFLDDFRSGVIGSKAFKHRQEIDGRADEDCKSRYTKEYDYEK